MANTKHNNSGPHKSPCNPINITTDYSTKVPTITQDVVLTPWENDLLHLVPYIKQIFFLQSEREKKVDQFEMWMRLMDNFTIVVDTGSSRVSSKRLGFGLDPILLVKSALVGLKEVAELAMDILRIV
jgi:hypothetical protein